MPNDKFFGTPRPLPRVLTCAATPKFCGRWWFAKTDQDYAQMVKERETHEVLCDSLTANADTIKRAFDRRHAEAFPRVKLPS